MRSEDDIREALEALADTAPDADDVLARVRARERGERRTALHTPVLVGISALATAAAAFVVPLAIDLPDADVPAGADKSVSLSTPAPRVNPTWQYAFSLPPEYRVRSWSVTADYQVANLMTPSDVWCEVVAYQENVFEPSWIPSTRSVVPLQRTTGYVANFADPGSSLPQAAPRIAWQYSKGKWATSACLGGSGVKRPLVERVVAKAVEPVPRELRVPFSIGYLPDNTAVESGGVVKEVVPVPSPMARFLRVEPMGVLAIKRSQGLPKSDESVISLTTYQSLSIEFRHGNSNPVGSSRVSVAGRQALLQKSESAAELLVHLDSHEVALSLADANADQELRKIAEGMDFASDLTDQSTWFDATLAIP